MHMNQETLRFIFGLKLRELRLGKALSLKELSAISGLSPSYLNEIEHGKKYPKAEKIVKLAASLGVPFEDLTSIRLGQELAGLSKLLETNLMKDFPFELFGVSAQTLHELMVTQPSKMSALIGTVLELARLHDLSVEEFFHAALRAYLDLHDNYFPELESEASEIRSILDLSGTRRQLAGDLCQLFAGAVRTEIQLKDFSLIAPELTHEPFVYDNRHGRLLINNRCSVREQVFILAREVAYQHLKIRERQVTASSREYDSYQILFDTFRSAYVAGALLLDEPTMVGEIDRFLSQETIDYENLRQWITGYPGTIESFFYRLAQLLPHHFDLSSIFLLKFLAVPQDQQYQMVRELHLSQLHAPHGVKTSEHYCRRWISIGLLHKASQARARTAIGVQRSAYYGTDNEYLCLSAAIPDTLVAGRVLSITLGVRIDEEVSRRVQFVDDPSIIRRQVQATCEQCGMEDCQDRVAPPTIQYQRDSEAKYRKAIERLLTR